MVLNDPQVTNLTIPGEFLRSSVCFLITEIRALACLFYKIGMMVNWTDIVKGLDTVLPWQTTLKNFSGDIYSIFITITQGQKEEKDTKETEKRVPKRPEGGGGGGEPWEKGVMETEGKDARKKGDNIKGHLEARCFWRDKKPFSAHWDQCGWRQKRENKVIAWKEGDCSTNALPSHLCLAVSVVWSEYPSIQSEKNGFFLHKGKDAHKRKDEREGGISGQQNKKKENKHFECAQ